jgi:YebC/PmpR family DNA-binding regulatory protein
MSGHSKWSTIKHKKGAQDAKRGKIFTKLIREIIVAARLGGGDPSANPRLRSAIAAARAENMPKDNIERAIKKGTGELEGSNYEEITYEGYGPGGIAVLVEAMTDNRQRTVAEVRHIFSKRGGSLGEPNSVAWMFSKKGLITIEKSKVDEDTLMELVLNAGADDMQDANTEWEVHTSVEAFEAVREAIEKKGIPMLSAQVSMVPSTTIRIEDEDMANQVIKLMDALEDNDDVQHVYANFDIPDVILEKVGG